VNRKTWLGIVAAVVTLVVVVGALLSVRSHVSVATDALVLIIPVVIGVSVGGFSAGAVAVVLGFVAYDFYFIPPYGTLSVGAGQNWLALVVYVIVVLIVARVVAFQLTAREQAHEREVAIRRLFEVTQQMISALPLDDLLHLVVTTVRETFETTWVALLLPEGDRLTIAAEAGTLSEDERSLITTLDQPHTLILSSNASVSRVALTADGRPVGHIVVAGADLNAYERELFGTFANQAALAIERSQLREQALRTEVLEAADQWRNALMGAVSHDLRTPLASMKLAVSTLRDSSSVLTTKDRDDLLATIEDQSDDLARLVANLLDMARLEAGGLSLRRGPHAVSEFLDDAVRSAGGSLKNHVIRREIDSGLPLVDVDEVLITRVLVNLLSNAAQHSPEGTTITVGAQLDGELVRVSVSDEGSGVPPDDRARIFKMLDRRAGSGRAGLGLAISTSFVAAHSQTLSVDDAPSGGARFSFTLPVSATEEFDE